MPRLYNLKFEQKLHKIFSLDLYVVTEEMSAPDTIPNSKQMKSRLNDVLECAFAQQFCSLHLGTSPMCHAAKCCRHSSPAKSYQTHYT